MMKSLNIKKWILLELQITRTRHPLSILQKKCLSSRPQKIKNKFMKGAQNRRCTSSIYKKNHYAKIEYKGMKTVGVTYYTNQAPPTHFGWKKCLSSTPVKIIKYLSNVHKIGGAHLQCMNNHKAKFDYKEMKTVGFTDYTNQAPPCISDGKKNVKFNTRKNKKIFIKCAQNRRCTSSMYEQSLGKV